MDLYELLGVAPVAGLEEIKRAYRRLARRYHPDINPGDRTAAVRFRAVVEAYEVLIDPDRRREYDLLGRSGVAGEVTATFGFEGFDFSVHAVDGAAASTFGDLFADVIHDAVGGSVETPTPGADLFVPVTVGFEEAARGVEQQVTVIRRDVCRGCRGRGVQSVAEATCASCRGAGSVRSARGHMMFTKTCGRCGGTGLLRHATCAACQGLGVESRSETTTFTIPAGVSPGEQIRIPGLGHAGTRGAVPGDLYVTLHVTPHRVFRREGDDLLVGVPVAVHEAALGARFDIPTLDGPVRLRVPPGTQSGQRFRLRDRGVCVARKGTRGDLIVEIRIVLPSVIDQRSRELLHEFGHINTEDVRAGLWRDATAS
ncbi:MAG: J domain-containing protein [Acidobacteriota bacterium]